MEAALVVWAGDAPEHAAAFVANLRAGDAKLTMLQTLASSWAESDPDNALKWVSQLPAAEQARAYDGIVPELANVNPAVAAALLEKVSPDGRAGIGETIAAQWLETDPVAARAWLTKAPLPDEVKQRLLSQSPSPPPLPPLKQRP